MTDLEAIPIMRDVLAKGCIPFCLFLCAAARLVRAEHTPPQALPSVPDLAKADHSAEVYADLPPKELELKLQEKLTYDIQVNGVPAGKAQLEVIGREHYEGENGPEVWVIKLEIRSNRAVSLFYEVRDNDTSRIDVKGGFSRFYHLVKHEGEVRQEEFTSCKYEYANAEVDYERALYPEKDGPKKELRLYPPIPLTGKVLDPLAAIYYLRKVDFAAIEARKEKKDRYFLLPICADRRIWNTKVCVLERSYEDFANLKNRACIRITPLAEFKGLFERKGNMTIWLDAATKIPVKMTVEIPIGTAEGVLTSYANAPLPE